VKTSIRHKLESLNERYDEIAYLLADPDVIGDQDQFRELSKEYARLETLARDFRAFQALEADLATAQELTEEDDPDMKALGQEELGRLTARQDERAICIWKSAPARVAMKRRFLPATCFACMAATQSGAAGRSRY
jgi:protein subunit release factor A